MVLVECLVSTVSICAVPSPANTAKRNSPAITEEELIDGKPLVLKNTDAFSSWEEVCSPGCNCCLGSATSQLYGRVIRRKPVFITADRHYSYSQSSSTVWIVDVAASQCGEASRPQSPLEDGKSEEMRQKSSFGVASTCYLEDNVK